MQVLVPGPRGSGRADGAFDLVALGTPVSGSTWPAASSASWPAPGPSVPSSELALLDQANAELAGLLFRHLPDVAMAAPAAGGPPAAAANGDWFDTVDRWRVGAPDAFPEPGCSGPGLGWSGGGRTSPVHDVGLYVPINPLAARRPHNGFGFVNYVLVLGDRGPGASDGAPSPMTAWLLGGLPRLDVVVVENATASAWRSRALRGQVAVDTRIDLWRLMAYASVMIDLRPGALLARECVESLRYGTPVVVPAGTAAAHLAALGGGLWYRDPSELLACVDAIVDADTRDVLGAQGQAAADRLYGDPAAFVGRVAAAMAGSAPPAVDPFPSRRSPNRRPVPNRPDRPGR
ncbi:MAG TPA: hypothetical protein VHB02_07070 [Acidimicrobiales bacterium]|nr:hypothetical protein [Acidimicrobiales bacterium]